MSVLRMSTGRSFQIVGPETRKLRQTSSGSEGEMSVSKVVRHLVTQTPVDCQAELELDTICHIEPVQVDV